MTRTVVARSYGGPEVLALQDIELPEPGEGQVLVDVRAAGTNPIDYKLYSGDMGRDPGALPMPVGMEVSGVVVAAAPGATGYTGALTLGDEVIATGITSGYADQVLAASSDVGHKPASLSFEEAAGLLLVGGTAWHLLTKTGVGTNDTVLIHGASGGVGLMAVQLAAARGARVIATASPARHDQLRRYGAEPVAYGDGLADRVRAIGAVDAALDLVGTDEALDVSVELVADRTRIATIAGFGRAAELGIAALSGADGGQQIRDASRVELIKLAAAGRIEVTVDKVFPLSEAADAHRYLQTGHARGKVVLVP
ncbi:MULTISPECIES: NADP-dependent oxidoreductase [unclassified Mycolicibacterium]|uniref:NADP-dependent oxidoreductase n=1 Tax=unclassified Mycolicibacterium TaxID=2636767 RepID=UPI001F4C060F|nr:NADP-dependent oxidoreductase [Mycolicibacterium sp. YH-1]UNB52341.1 NADP-dependent oxidoreductase [Mycolicibacterium sp. YH-1]